MKWPILTKEDVKELLRLVSSRTLSIKDGSGIVERFETEFAQHTGTKYALAQNSGTSTLHAAYFAIGLRPGDEVLVPSYTWHSTVSPLFNLHATPVFCEVDNTYCIDPEDIKKKITSKTKAITCVHMWGHPCRMDEIRRIAKEHNLWIIEDCSHAFGSEYKNQKVGSIGDIGCFSLQKNKPLSAGEGGVLTTNNKELLEKALFLGHPKRSEPTLGFKYRPHPLAVSIAYTQLKKFKKLNDYRNQNYEYLTRKLKEIPFIQGMENKSYCTARSHYTYKIQLETENIEIQELIDKLKETIPVKKDSYSPLHLNSLFQNTLPGTNECRYNKQGDLPFTERLYQKTFELKIPVKPDKHLMESYKETIKRTCEQFQIKALEEKRFTPPLSVEYETTLRCNLDCTMCYQKGYHDREKTINEMKACEFLENIGDIKEVSITGGECLIKEDIFELIEGLYKKGIKMKLLTNGVTTENTIKRLKQYPFAQIRTSIDGPEEIHDKIRQPNSFKTTMNFIEEMKDKDIRVNSVKIRKDQCLEIVQEQLNKKGIKTTTIPDEAYTKEEIADTKRKLNQILKNPELLVKEGKNKKKGKKGICKNLIYQTARIDPKGNVIACRMIRNSFGNIKEQSLESIWNSKEFQDFRYQLAQLDLPICQNCPKRMK